MDVGNWVTILVVALLVASLIAAAIAFINIIATVGRVYVGSARVNLGNAYGEPDWLQIRTVPQYALGALAPTAFAGIMSFFWAAPAFLVLMFVVRMARWVLR